MAQAKPKSPADRRGGCPQIEWGAALAQHDRWLRTVVFSRLGESQAVDEVMQEVSLAAIKQRPSLEDPGKVGPWLYRVAVRQALLYRRKQGRRRKLTDRIAQRFQPTAHDTRAADPLVWLLADEQRKLIRDALRQLSGRDAEILLLKYTENWSYRRLAERLGISHSAVEARLHRARGRLRAALAARSPTEVAP
jgi:RNA polymerase sigma-70 factor (ECF subfamily)